jgi:hypothetical protein
MKIPPEKCGKVIGLIARCQRPVGHEGDHSQYFLKLTAEEKDVEAPRMKYAKQ